MSGATKFMLIGLAFMLCKVAIGQALIKVTNAKGKPIEDALIISKRLVNRKECVGFTNQQGLLKLSIVGNSTIQVKKLGYKVYEADVLLSDTLKITLEEDKIDLKDVVITGQYDVTARQASIYNVAVIDRKRIEQMAANNLRDVLTNQLNIQITQDNILGPGVSVNGIAGQNIKILIDGVPVIGRLNGNIDLSEINLSNIERIEIVKGPMSVVYGTDALGGVINLISRRKVKEQISGSLNGYFDSKKTYNVDTRVAFKIKQVEVATTGGRNFFGGYSPHFNWRDRSMLWKPRLQYFSNMSIAFNIKQSRHVTFLNFFDEDIINRGAPTVTPYDAYGFDAHYHTQRLDLGEQSDIYLQGQNHLQFTNSASFYTRKVNTYRKNLVTGREDLTAGNNDQDTSRFMHFMIRGIWTNTGIKKLQQQGGYDFNLETGAGYMIEGTRQLIQDYGFLYTLEYKPITKIALKGGIRVAYNSRYGAPVVPSFNFRYDISTELILRLSYAQGFRAPGIKELDMYFVDVNHNIQGNSHLKAEKSYNAQLELIYQPKVKGFNFSINPSIFFNHVYNMISLALVNPASQLYSYINITKFQSTGVNLNSNLSHKFFDFTVGYAFIGRYNDLSEQANVPHFGWASELSSSLTINIPKINTSISAFYKFNGVIPGYSINANNQIYQTMIESYSMLDISANVKIWKERFTISGGVKNALNVTSIGYNAPSGNPHSGVSSSMSIGMGLTGFASLKINLTNNFKKSANEN